MSIDNVYRSLIQVGEHPEADECLRNWQVYCEHEIDYNTEEDKKILEYLKLFYTQMSSPPDISLVREHFERQDEIETVNRLEEIVKAVPYIRTNFLSQVRAEQDLQQTKNLIILCRDASTIAEHGRTTDGPKNKRVMRGVSDAVDYLYERLHTFTRVEGGEKLEGIITEDCEEILAEYEKTAKTDKFSNRNLFGLEPVDSVCKGHRRGEFWIHTAFVGELKTTLALNYAYNNVVKYGKNIFYAILEMPYSQLRRQLYVIHSANGKFVTEWYDEDGYTGLDYRKVRDGELSPRDKERLVIVARDFQETTKNKLYVWRPKKDDEATIDGIRRRAEMFDNKYGCDGMVIDHLGLVTPKRFSADNVATQNDVVKNARLMALNFARGKGVPVLGLWQMNRQGKIRADKADGRYDISAISYANEIEKSADVITYTYLNDVLRNEGKFYLGNLKNRDNPIFDRMVGKIIWQSKRMRDIVTGMLDLDADNIVKASQVLSCGIEMMYDAVA